MLPGEDDLRIERGQLMDTLDSLTPDELESAPTLCAGWSPRDLLAHMLTVEDGLGYYLRSFGRISAANEKAVEELRATDLETLLVRGRRWAAEPGLVSRVAAWGLLGDNATHHQDLLRGIGRTRDIPEASRRAILREGSVLGVKKLASYRVVPSDIGKPRGRGQEVHGTAEALGLWLSGRQGLEPELTFA